MSCDRSQIFDRFYRIPNGDRWKHNGIGLGLTSVKKLSEYLGGSIVVESGNGQTCFTVKFPLIVRERYCSFPVQKLGSISAF
jgi:signal transduction histidine kinase